MPGRITPILLLGAGRMGGAMVRGWLEVEAFAPSELIVRDPEPSPEALRAGTINPPDQDLVRADTVLLGVKPQMWKVVAAEVEPLLSPDAVVVSIAAGVPTAALSTAFGARRVARVMPTTAVAIGQGVASIFAADDEARAAAHGLFDPIAATVDLASEDLMDAATAVSGSAPAYLYAFIEALEAAGENAGLPAEDARILARRTIVSAAALMGQSGEDPAELRRQVTSPGGTTEAALKVLMGEGGFPQLLETAVAAAVARSKALGG
jgi:pyrroline-5-carboxylate reductase